MSAQPFQFTWALNPDAARRQRRKHHKVFTGCTTCKLRRLKCDETKPSCIRCQKADRVCEYKQVKAWVFDDNEASTKPEHPPPIVQLSQKDKRALAVYTDRAAPVFSSYFGQDFWTTIVMQVGQEHDIVRKALACASSLVESFEVPENQVVLRTEFYRNYNMAIRSLRAAQPPPTTEALLTACLLFTSFEFVLGSFEQGLLHCRSGLEIAKARIKTLKEKGKLDSPEASFLLTYINPIMMDYALQADAYGTALLPQEELAKAQPSRHEVPKIPTSFPSIHQAHHCLSGLIHHIAVSGASVETPWTDAKAQRIGQCLEGWPLALSAFERHLEPSSPVFPYQALLFLRCNHQLAQMLLADLSRTETETESDSEARKIKHTSILRQYKSLRTDDRLEEDEDVHHVPKADDYIEGVVPVFIIATTSTDAAVRNEALQSLKTLRRAEANWSSEQAHQVASFLIELDSMGLTSDHFSTFHQSYIRTMYHRESLPCLHTASVQWPLGLCLPLLRPTAAVTAFLENCPCRSADSSTATRPVSFVSSKEAG